MYRPPISLRPNGSSRKRTFEVCSPIKWQTSRRRKAAGRPADQKSTEAVAGSAACVPKDGPRLGAEGRHSDSSLASLRAILDPHEKNLSAVEN